MVRTYKRKTERGSYTPAQLLQAMANVESGMPLLRASRLFGVSRRVLQRHTGHSGTVRHPGKLRLGRYEPSLPEEVEKTLEDHIIGFNNMYYGFTAKEVRKLAYELAKSRGLDIFNSEKGKAGPDWLHSFLVRHPNLSLRIPESTSLNRVEAFSEDTVNHFFQLLCEQYENILATEGSPLDASRVFNVDETGLTVVQKSQKVIAPKGAKQVGKVTSAERGKTVTITAAMSASGMYVPPMMIFPRKRMNPQLMTGAPPGTIAANSPSGWTDSSLFMMWLEHFVKFVKPSPEQKVILLLDGHASHKTINAASYAKQNGVIMICLPPHTSHKLQPLDRTFFGPLKSYYYRAVENWMAHNLGCRVAIHQVAPLFATAYNQSATISNAESGFRCTGIWPLNSSIFSREEFMPATVTSPSEETITSRQSTASRSLVEASGDSAPTASGDVSATQTEHRASEPGTPSSSGIHVTRRQAKRRNATTRRAQVITSSPFKSVSMSRISNRKNSRFSKHPSVARQGIRKLKRPTVGPDMVIQANVHQGSEVFPSTSRGRQCLAIAVTALAYNNLKVAYLWSPSDLDVACHLGDDLYNTVIQIKPDAGDRDGYLNMADIPGSIKVLQNMFRLEEGAISHGRMSAAAEDGDLGFLSMESAISTCTTSGNNCLLTVLKYTSAIILTKRTRQYFIFDSHAKNEKGLPAEDGKCVLMHFENLDTLCSYVRYLVEYLRPDGHGQVEFEVQEVLIRPAFTSMENEAHGAASPSDVHVPFNQPPGTSGNVESQVTSSKRKKRQIRSRSASRKGHSETGENQSPSVPVVPSPGNKEKHRMSGSKKVKSNSKVYRCLVCDELYVHPPQEDWIGCQTCNQWAHEACTAYNGAGPFTCDLCL